jgi:purine-cytosine permease-like protein
MYFVILPCILNAATITGFSLISAIVGGQTLAAVNPGNVSIDVGIVITCLLSWAVSLLGYKWLHSWERWQWLPNLIFIIIAVGCGGHNLRNQYQPPPATASQILTFGGLMAGYFITFGGTVSDYSIYHSPNAPK